MKERILALFTAIDDALAAAAPGASLDVYHIGRSALVWAYGAITTTRVTPKWIAPRRFRSATN